MGILAELEKLNPETIVADAETAKVKLLEYEGRIAAAEIVLEKFYPAINAIIGMLPVTPSVAPVLFELENAAKAFAESQQAKKATS